MKDRIKEFNQEGEFINSIVLDILDDLQGCLNVYSEIRILLSGGGTPIPVYKKLDQDCQFFDRMKIGLVDERFVPTNSDFSNELLLRNCFSKQDADSYYITGMVVNDQDKIENLAIVKESYQMFIDRTDIVVLGMGKDGHTASLFPNDSYSISAMESEEINLFNTNAPDHPKERITFGMDFINNVGTIYLLITGKEKLKVLSNLEEQLPIHTLLQKRKDIKIYYLKD